MSAIGEDGHAYIVCSGACAGGMIVEVGPCRPVVILRPHIIGDGRYELERSVRRVFKEVNGQNLVPMVRLSNWSVTSAWSKRVWWDEAGVLDFQIHHCPLVGHCFVAYGFLSSWGDRATTEAIGPTNYNADS